MARVLTPQAEDFPRWYQDVLAKAQLAENGPVRGTMVIRPWAFGIWELVQRGLDDRIKASGARNAYFPLLIPESYLRREADHIEGFSPELAVVTVGGGKELAEPAVVRPTSETIINASLARWISSYRDLPFKINQWANVVRWELRPRLLLRTSEFLWQEGHTAHASCEEAHSFALEILEDTYAATMERDLAIPVWRGRKTDREKFAGAVVSWSCEGLMRDGKALQMGTSHELGQNFANAFDIAYTDERGTRQRPWQTSWGASTRLLGAVIMVHGDDQGLRLPPRVAPVQVVVLVAREGEGVFEQASRLVADLTRAGVRAELDPHTDVSVGRRIVEWELRGVPVRVELGPRDIASGQVPVALRAEAVKTTHALDGLAQAMPAILETQQDELLRQARAFRDRLTSRVTTIGEAIEQARVGAARVPWATLGLDGERRLLEAGISVRCLVREDGALVDDPEAGGVDAIVARAY
ncbi:proline--tRNA ligase [Solirubrobacter ginsenosidimutans]|uniref:Proline--tRNA ligase n=1 Tax=Solirubrobacter ginsenosidimutans TaxID=490573 RepID=A0A9X3S2S2_9ACTN|nr:proline--tRNA ligase [Solirubrobacter ginsenosidimutans]MDA0158953.1 proline--tRNA ligase [Solirubrobacter ginsenosidimutans]